MTNKIKALVVGLIVLICAVVISYVPDASASVLSKMAVAQSGDSLQVTVFYTLRGGVDSVKYTVVSTNGKPAVSKIGKSASGSVGFMILGPLEGETDTVTVTPTAYKLGQAFAQTPLKAVHTRSITTPPEVTDSVKVAQALLNARFAQSLTIQNASFSCDAQWLDYRHSLLIAPKGTQSPECQGIFDTTVREQNLRVLSALDAGYPWTATQDSIWRASPIEVGTGV